MDDSHELDNLGPAGPPGGVAPDGDPRRIRAPSHTIRADLHLELVATDDNATLLRHRFADWLAVDVPSEVLDDIVLAVYEALANATEHAYADHAGPVSLQAYRADDHLVVVVTDDGVWRAHTADPLRRRGIPMMRLLVPTVDIDRRVTGTTVRLRVDLPAAQPPAAAD
ncbi:MAG: ATP-binding protein [Pseudonocardia sp.]|nr:ATP-binding protein [Pseudonocardia sp.]